MHYRVWSPRLWWENSGIFLREVNIEQTQRLTDGPHEHWQFILLFVKGNMIWSNCLITTILTGTKFTLLKYCAKWRMYSFKILFARVYVHFWFAQLVSQSISKFSSRCLYNLICKIYIGQFNASIMLTPSQQTNDC